MTRIKRMMIQKCKNIGVMLLIIRGCVDDCACDFKENS